MIRAALCLAFWLTASSTAAQPFDLPERAEPLVDRTEDLGQHDVAVAPFENGKLDTIFLEGPIARQSWRVPENTATTFELMAPMRQAIVQQGFDILLDCATKSCGGFDFRFEIEVMDAPDMHVDLYDFHYLSAAKPGAETISLLVSRGQGAGYIQAITVFGRSGLPRRTAPGAPQATITATLLEKGHAILPDLDFASGDAKLGAGPYPSLDTLAAFLRFNTTAVVVIVGHTDSIGDLDNNISLSKRRAEVVRQRLVESYAIAPEKVRAEGMGYLAPVASNLTPEGRTRNRRVEVVLLEM